MSGLKDATIRTLVMSFSISSGGDELGSLIRPTCLCMINGELDCLIILASSAPSALVMIVEGIEVPRMRSNKVYRKFEART